MAQVQDTLGPELLAVLKRHTEATKAGLQSAALLDVRLAFEVGKMVGTYEKTHYRAAEMERIHIEFMECLGKAGWWPGAAAKCREYRDGALDTLLI
jgi:hypothetical protein